VYLSILKKRNFRIKDLKEILEKESRFEPKESFMKMGNIGNYLITPLLSNGLIVSIDKGRYNPVSPSLIISNIENKIKEDLTFFESINGTLEEVYSYAEESDIDKDISCTFGDISGLFSELADNKQKIKKLTIIDKDRQWIDGNSWLFKDEAIIGKWEFIKNEKFATGIIFCEYIDEVCLYFKIFNPITTKVSPVKVKDNFLYEFLKKKILEED
jgi:hypothetical protein